MKIRDTDKGTVLITTLLTMTIMAAITVSLLDDVRVAVRRTVNVNAYAQADWQGRGAEDFVRAWLTNNFVELPEQAQSVALRDPEPIVLPTQAGIITVRLKDASHCFNLNAVLNEEGLASGHAAEFINLATFLGVPLNQADALSFSLMDWIDSDQNPRSNGAEDGTYLRANPPYRTADTVMTTPSEMRALNGMDEDLWSLFKPFVCTGAIGDLPSVNVNSIEASHISVLAAALSQVEGLSPEDGVGIAQSLIEERPAQGYADQQAMQAIVANFVSPDDADALPMLARVSTQVSSLFVEVVTRVGPAERIRIYRYDGVDSGALILTYRGWGRENFRPEIEIEDVQ